ncbi:MAG: hypothetical protein AB7I19_17845 [Planctomycetota bacterium]
MISLSAAIDVTTGLWLAGIASVACLLALSIPIGARREHRPLGVLRTLLGLALFAAMATLAATGFSAILTERSMHGWALWLHVGVGGGFTVLLGVGAVLWLPRLLARGELLSRCLASLTLLAAGVSAGSILIATFPILDTIAMERAHDVHRWAGIATVPCFVALMVSSLRRRRARLRGHGDGQSQAKASAVLSA